VDAIRSRLGDSTWAVGIESSKFEVLAIAQLPRLHPTIRLEY
jgi:hypothetical protein